jgi:hypothetical protein
MTVLLFTFAASGLVLAGVCVPLILGKIPPNGLYGFRVRKTIEKPEIWYPVNKYGGLRLLVASLLEVLAAIGFYFVQGLGIDTYAYAVLIVWVVMFTIAIVSSFRFMNKL